MTSKCKRIPSLQSDKHAKRFEVDVAEPAQSKSAIPGCKPARAGKTQRIGFLDGEFEVPDDFDNMGGTTVADLFADGGTE